MSQTKDDQPTILVQSEMVVVEIAHSGNLSWCNEQHPAGISDVDLVPSMSIALQNVQL